MTVSYEKKFGDEKSDRLLNNVKQYGDRTSSLMTLYPGFKSFEAGSSIPFNTESERLHERCKDEVDHGQIRYAETARSWIAATEPLTSKEKKAALFQTFESEAKRLGKHSLMVPVTEKLSAELAEHGYHRIQVGSEPIFELGDYFNPTHQDPLVHFPHARTLLKRGYTVEAIDLAHADEPTKTQLQSLTQMWIENRNTVPLQFLNQIDPWKFSELKKFFVVRLADRIIAYLSVAPVAGKNSCFFADYVRHPQSRAGTVELLFIESMRQLHRQGVSEVRLGICPFAQMGASSTRSFLIASMKFAFARVTFPLNFKSIYEFKSKFKPTRWEPLYLVSSKSIGFQTAVELARVHFPQGIGNALAFTWKQKIAPYLKPGARNFTLPQSLAEFIRKTPLTHSFAAFFLVLHTLRMTQSFFNTLYLTQGFSPGHFTWSGLFMGPLFHNHSYHLAGDVSTFWLFGVFLELIMGSRVFFLVTALGLWASNPLSWALVETGMKVLTTHIPAETYGRFLKEIDYGSSNAVYAFVGALAAILIRPKPLLVPFIVNGALFCIVKQSLLSLHHLTALASGYFISLLLVTESKPEADSRARARF